MKDAKRLTDSQARALAILESGEIHYPSQFAHQMWPDAEGWQRSSRRGQRGSGMNLAGGSYLGKLRRAGLIYDRYVEMYGPTYRVFELSSEGKAALKRHRAEETDDK